MKANRRELFGASAAALVSLCGSKVVGHDGGFLVPDEFASQIERSQIINMRRVYAFASVTATPHLVGKVRVFLDGKEVEHCDEANAREGWVRIIERDDETGMLKLNEDCTEVCHKVLYGDVRIERKAGC